VAVLFAAWRGVLAACDWLGSAVDDLLLHRDGASVGQAEIDNVEWVRTHIMLILSTDRPVNRVTTFIRLVCKADASNMHARMAKRRNPQLLDN
jgi:hypothetical protein